MGTFHAVIGLVEGAITAVVILGILKARPDLLLWNSKKSEVNPK